MLKAVPGVTSVSTKPTQRDYYKRRPNDYGVTYKLRLPGGAAPVTRRSACTEPDVADARPTLAHALLAAIDNACEELGVQVPDGLARPAPPSQAELEWIEEWCDAHAAPDTITPDMADAALRERRAATGSQASSGATSGGRSAAAILQTAQVLRAQVRAAERHAERALLSAERWRAELESHTEPKRRRLDESASVPDHPRVALGGVNHWPPLPRASRCRESNPGVVLVNGAASPPPSAGSGSVKIACFEVFVAKIFFAGLPPPLCGTG